jgi:peroxiredoxin
MRRFLSRRAEASHRQNADSDAQTAGNGSPSTAKPSAKRATTSARPPQSLLGLEMPGILFNNFDRRFLDLGELSQGGLVIYTYPGCKHSPSDGINSLDADLLQHRTYSALRERFAETVPGSALMALSSISPTQQFHYSPDLAWDQDEDTPFQHYLVSDEMLQFATELGLPTFDHEGETYYERLTLIAREGRIQRVFHPVQPGQDAHQALTWLQLH